MKTARLLSLVILSILCLTAFYGSYHMINDPSGQSLNLPAYLLHDTVFTSYQTVGWLLLFTVALFSFLAIILTILKVSTYSFYIILQGVVLCIFIFVQLLLFDETFLIQYLFLGMAIVLIVLGAFQNQRRLEGE